MVKVSVIMPVYNNENYLKKAILSLSNQTLKDIELICVNDGSSDGSLNALKSLQGTYDFIKIVDQENQGSGIARNQGLDEAEGEYVAFLDADDIYVDNDSLEKMYTYGLKNNADMVGGNLQRISPNNKAVKNFNYEKGNYTYFEDYGVINPENYGIPWAFYKNIFKRAFLNENNIRFPDLKRGQDPVFLSEVLTKIDKLYTVCTDLYGYNYANSGGANKKVNSHDKKSDYMNHFKRTFEILENGNLDTLSNAYKQQLIIYLSLHDNRTDKELFKIIHDIFEDGKESYFERVEDELLYLQLCLVNYKDNSTYNKSMQDIKNKLFEYTILKNIFINGEILDKYLEATAKNPDFKYTNNTDDLYICHLKKDIENSNSWKITKPLRATKRASKNVLRKIKNKVVVLW